MNTIHTNRFLLSPTHISMGHLTDLETQNRDLNLEFSSDGQSGLYYKTDRPRLFITQETQLSNIQSHIKNNKFMNERFGLMSQAMGQLVDIASRLQEQLVHNRSAQAVADGTFHATVNDALTQVQRILETRFNGEFLFSGTATQTPPVDATQLLADTANGDQPTAAYYQGTTTAIDLRLSETSYTAVNVTAASSGIQKLILALRLARNANITPPTPDTTRIGLALDWTKQALDEIANDRASIDHARAQTQQVNEDLEEYSHELSRSIKTIGYRDQSEVLMELQENRSALKMSQVMFFRFLDDITKMIEGTR